MNDISICVNDCAASVRCLRHKSRAKSMDPNQSYCAFHGDASPLLCPGFLGEIEDDGWVTVLDTKMGAHQ